MAFQLPDLSYPFGALEPHIDAKTMEIHHGKHHATYVNNLNMATQGTDLEHMKLEEIMANISKLTPAVRNNGGGHYNHSLFWSTLAPAGANELSDKMNIHKAIMRDFETLEEFKAKFKAAALGQFGSGWAWLCVDKADKLFICATPNQDNPLMDVNDFEGTPILGLDVWEHAYYLNYQNRRPDYVDAFFNVVNWHEVTKRYNEANPGASNF
jgi:Fe-Mn family superoxide dismutase